MFAFLHVEKQKTADWGDWREDWLDHKTLLVVFMYIITFACGTELATQFASVCAYFLAFSSSCLIQPVVHVGWLCSLHWVVGWMCWIWGRVVWLLLQFSCVVVVRNLAGIKNSNCFYGVSWFEMHTGYLRSIFKRGKDQTHAHFVKMKRRKR